MLGPGGRVRLLRDADRALGRSAGGGRRSPSTVAAIPASAGLPAFTSRQGARFLAEHMSAAIPVRAESAADVQPGRRADRDRAAGRRAPDDVESPTVAAAMTDRRRRRARWSTSATAGTGWSPTRCCAGACSSTGGPGSAPVGEVIDVVGADRPLGDSAAEALILLLDRDAEFLVVTDAGRRLRGVVAPRDFTVSPTTAGVSLHEQLRRADDTDELVDRARRVPGAARRPAHRGLASGPGDRGLLDHPRHHGPAGDHPDLRRSIRSCRVDAFTWLSLGSNGRREAVPAPTSTRRSPSTTDCRRRRSTATGRVRRGPRRAGRARAHAATHHGATAIRTRVLPHQRPVAGGRARSGWRPRRRTRAP